MCRCLAASLGRGGSWPVRALPARPASIMANVCTVQACGFWRAADQVRILHPPDRLPTYRDCRPAHRDHQLRSGSAAPLTDARDEPVAALVCGGLSVTRTNPAQRRSARARQSTGRGGVAAAINGGSTPRVIGTKCGVNLPTRPRCRHSAARSSTAISGVCGARANWQGLQFSFALWQLAEQTVGAASASTGDAGRGVDRCSGSIGLFDQRQHKCVQRRRRIAARVGNADLTLDLGWPDVSEP